MHMIGYKGAAARDNPLLPFFSDPQLDLGGEELDHHLPAAHRLHLALSQPRQRGRRRRREQGTQRHLQPDDLGGQGCNSIDIPFVTVSLPEPSGN